MGSPLNLLSFPTLDCFGFNLGLTEEKLEGHRSTDSNGKNGHRSEREYAKQRL